MSSDNDAPEVRWLVHELHRTNAKAVVIANDPVGAVRAAFTLDPDWVKLEVKTGVDYGWDFFVLKLNSTCEFSVRATT